MSDKFSGYSEILNQLVGESIRCTPETWQSGMLFIECDGRRINYRLKNEKHSEKAVISTELAKLCEQLYVAFAQHGEAWAEAHVHFHNDNGTWRFQTNFVRPEAKA